MPRKRRRSTTGAYLRKKRANEKRAMGVAPEPTGRARRQAEFDAFLAANKGLTVRR